MSLITSGGDIEIGITGNTNGLESALADAEKTVQDRFGAIADIAGTAMTAFGAATVGGLGFAATKAAEFGKSMADVATLGVADLGRLRGGVEDLAMKYGIDLNDAAKQLYMTLSAGLPEDAAILALDVAARGAQAGVGTLASSLDVATSVMNAWGLKTSDTATTMRNMENIMGQVATTVKDGKTNIDDLAGAIGQVAPIMSTAGVSTKDFFSAVQALTASGLPASAAMTQLRAVAQAVIMPVSSASKAAAEMGLDFSVTALKTKGLAGFLEDVKRATGGNVETMGQLFTSVEALGAVTSLTGQQAGQFKKGLDDMADAQKNLNDMSQAYEKNNPALAFEKAKASLDVLTIEIGQAAIPAFASFLGVITPALEVLLGFVREHPTITASFAAIALAVGGVSLVVGPLLLAIPQLAATFATIKGFAMAEGLIAASGAIEGVTVASTGALVGVTGLAAAIAGPVGLAAGIAFALTQIAAMVIALGRWEEAQEKLEARQQAWSGEADNQLKILEDLGVQINTCGWAEMDYAEKQQVVNEVLAESRRVRMEGLDTLATGSIARYTEIANAAIEEATKTTSIWSEAWSWISSLWGGESPEAPMPPMQGAQFGGVIGFPGYASGGRVGVDTQAFRWNEAGGEIAVAPVGTRILDHGDAMAVARDVMAMATTGGPQVNIHMPNMVVRERADVDYMLARMGEHIRMALSKNGGSAQTIRGYS